jgi:thiol:disulfide interchange protein DsbC
MRNQNRPFIQWPRSVRKVFLAQAACALALIAATAQADEQVIRRILREKAPDTQILSVRKLPYAGLYEVAVQREGENRVYYTDASAEIILVGANLIETRTERSLTEERLRQLSAIAWKDLPFRWAVSTRRGDGRREIAIFSDPNCPYCRKFEKDLAALDNITVHVFMYAVVKPESVRQTKSVWCSKDRTKAWNDLMLRNIEPTALVDCENPIEELIALGRRLGTTSTPTWYLPNGEKYTGALPMKVVVPLLNATVRRR